jgi:hypothetical protein
MFIVLLSTAGIGTSHQSLPLVVQRRRPSLVSFNPELMVDNNVDIQSLVYELCRTAPFFFEVMI